MLKHTSLILTAAALSACASTPDVTYSYYPARSITAVTVTQTISCTDDKQKPILSYTPQVTTTYAADYSAAGAPYTLPIRSLDHTFSDTDAGVTLTDDGRLKGINSTSTGQGETILKSALSLAATLGLGGGNPAGLVKGKKKPPPPPKPSSLCKAIAKWGNKDGVVTLVYTKLLQLENIPGGAYVVMDDTSNNPTAYTELKAADLNAALPQLAAQILPETEITPAAFRTPPVSSTADYTQLTLRDTANIKLLVETVSNAPNVPAAVISPNSITIPGPHLYSVPIPTAAFFGADKFSLTLSDAGAITAIDYGKTNGTASALNVATAAATAALPPPPPAAPVGTPPPPPVTHYDPQQNPQSHP